MILRTPVSRRRFIAGAAASAALWPRGSAAQAATDEAGGLFQHGVASGDPLPDAVILWTRVTPPPTRSAIGPVDVRWLIAADERLARVVAEGRSQAAPERDFTVKVDATNLSPGRVYYYAFEAGGMRSPVGRTKTAPDGDRLRLAIMSCSNYPAGYFNAYRCVANRTEIDAVVHLGDYIYEFANGVYGDGTPTARVPRPIGEAATLADYRLRYATYRSDGDLQEAHRLHPFVTVWDDHEIANNAWSGGAPGYTGTKSAWADRLGAAYRAYLEWMPIRESRGDGVRLYRTLHFGRLVDLIMLDTRSPRDQQAAPGDLAALSDTRRSLLGATQEAWLFDELRSSRRSGATWRLLGQQVLFAPVSPPGVAVQNVDVWDGYPAARRRLLDFIAEEKIRDVAMLTGDIHSSWAIDLPRDVWKGYDARTGSGSLAVELVTPAISSPPLFSIAGIRERAPFLRLAMPHIKYLEGDSHGYVLLDATVDRLTADWYFVATIAERSDRELRGPRFVCERGSSRLALG